MGTGSTERLVQALEAADAPVGILERARSNAFNDFLSASATPIVDLVVACERAGLGDVAKRAKAGEFDADLVEGKKWAASPEGRSILGLFSKE